MHSNEARRSQDETAQERLRKELLTSGLYDLVPLAQVESAITRDHPAASAEEQIQLTLSTIRELVGDGLMQFDGWHDIPLDEAMSRVYDVFVNHYDDPATWAFAVWLGLTEVGAHPATA